MDIGVQLDNRAKCRNLVQKRGEWSYPRRRGVWTLCRQCGAAGAGGQCADSAARNPGIHSDKKLGKELVYRFGRVSNYLKYWIRASGVRVAGCTAARGVEGLRPQNSP